MPETETCENSWFKVDFSTNPATRQQENCTRPATEVVHSNVYARKFNVCGRCAKVLRTEDAVHEAVARGLI